MAFAIMIQRKAAFSWCCLLTQLLSSKGNGQLDRDGRIQLHRLRSLYSISTSLVSIVALIAQDDPERMQSFLIAMTLKAMEDYLSVSR